MDDSYFIYLTSFLFNYTLTAYLHLKQNHKIRKLQIRQQRNRRRDQLLHSIEATLKQLWNEAQENVILTLTDC